MDIFIRDVPVNCSHKQIKKFFCKPLAEFGIHHFHVDKFRGKPLANLTVLDVTSAQRFLAQYGVPANAPRSVRAQKILLWDGKIITCSKSRNEPDDYSVKALAHEASQRAAQAQRTADDNKTNSQNTNATRFAIQGVFCGVWDYRDTELVFTKHFHEPRQGIVSFGIYGAVLLLGGTGTTQRRININFHDCRNIVLGNYENPSISFTLQCPPKFYMVGGPDMLAEALMLATLGSVVTPRNKSHQTRVAGINDKHTEKVAGTCFVYRILLSNSGTLSSVRSLLSRGKKMPPTIPTNTSTIVPLEPLQDSFVRLEHDLADTQRYGYLPFSLRYQLYRLARNGVLHPLKVRQLLPKIHTIFQRYDTDAALSAVRRFYYRVPFAGPETVASELTLHTLQEQLVTLAKDYSHYKYDPENAYQIVKRHKHINLVHKVVVTPAGVYLEGPEPEPTNRVLRRYHKNSDDFIRVVFQDEDGGSVRYDPQASQTRIFHDRFKQVLDTTLPIAGKGFSFLGFSHSSLRAQSCWFMNPIFSDGSLKLPELILKELGDFSKIRIPAKCAARIGQNFTDTNPTIDLRPENVLTQAPVVRNGYDFSDGVGTISEQLLRRIRFQGYKGMVSLDDRLRGEVIMLRENMKKFDAPEAWNLEICGAAFNPLPMILNRQLIKILEDLGVQAGSFLDLQRAAVDKLRFHTTTSPINSASFLEEMNCPRATEIPSLIKLLNQIGLDYRQDPFLRNVVEMAVVTKLRDIKYRGRIPIEYGHTLYGIMDETGSLAPGEVYVVTESPPEGGQKVLIQTGIVVSRSPAMHPGDVQIVNAVDVAPNSPLKRLSNVIVFSQHGARDLPSQLSGGDLDGDQYHIIFDTKLIPPRTYPAALYPRISAEELDREVTRKDMSDFLVKFMESDQLGMICNTHLQLADQKSIGTYDVNCIKLASMASTAVDFSKTGIPVDMKQCPKYNRCRPDFMAPSPRVVVSESGMLDLEEEANEDDEALEDLDVERRVMRYYPSSKVLGDLYRNIDEQHFLTNMQQSQRNYAKVSSSKDDLLVTLLEYMKRQATQYGVLFGHHHELAIDVRAGYEESLVDILYNYAPSVHLPLSEQEAFAGTILGRKGGAQNKSLRELGKTMRERFEAVVEYTVMRIVKGDKQMRGVDDLDLLYDDKVEREVEALPRAIACLAVAIQEKGMEDRQLGRLQSFNYIAAGICLRELTRFMSSMNRSVLPGV